MYIYEAIVFKQWAPEKEEKHSSRSSAFSLTSCLGDVFRPQHGEEEPKQEAAISVNKAYRNRSSEILRWNRSGEAGE